ncbi:MAG: hypothetical protein RR201_03025 [Malacoplasma sp.]
MNEPDEWFSVYKLFGGRNKDWQGTLGTYWKSASRWRGLWNGIWYWSSSYVID